MIYVDLPTGGLHGAGVCGDNLAAALATLGPVERLHRRPTQVPLPGALLQLLGPSLRPVHSGLSAARSVGYAVFEDDLWARRAAVGALQGFDVIATACHWCEDALRRGGFARVVTIPHGVDQSRFNPALAVRRRRLDRFVIFSGGKFEFRKGQDIVARAFKIFADRHADAFLVAAWHNLWPQIMASMAASPHFPFTYVPGESSDAAVLRWLSDTGVDLARVELLSKVPNLDLAAVYGDTDVGLFPNRGEGATNLVLMEYLACGRAAVVTDFAGHRDIVTDANSYPLRAWRPIVLSDARGPRAGWCEPDVDEVLERLEEAYRDRSGLAERCRQAAADMAAFTWLRTAHAFLRLLVPDASDSHVRSSLEAHGV